MLEAHLRFKKSYKTAARLFYYFILPAVYIFLGPGLEETELGFAIASRCVGEILYRKEVKAFLGLEPKLDGEERDKGG